MAVRAGQRAKALMGVAARGGKNDGYFRKTGSCPKKVKRSSTANTEQIGDGFGKAGSSSAMLRWKPLFPT